MSSTKLLGQLENNGIFGISTVPYQMRQGMQNLENKRLGLRPRSLWAGPLFWCIRTPKSTPFIRCLWLSTLMPTTWVFATLISQTPIFLINATHKYKLLRNNEHPGSKPDIISLHHRDQHIISLPFCITDDRWKHHNYRNNLTMQQILGKSRLYWYYDIAQLQRLACWFWLFFFLLLTFIIYSDDVVIAMESLYHLLSLEVFMSTTNCTCKWIVLLLFMGLTSWLATGFQGYFWLN